MIVMILKASAPISSLLQYRSRSLVAPVNLLLKHYAVHARLEQGEHGLGLALEFT
jgi:hypothetical protein